MGHPIVAGVDGEQVSLARLVNWLPKQLEAWQAVEAGGFVLYGGSRGPGKSFWLRWSALLLLLRWAMQGQTGVRVGLFCETYADLRDRQISKINVEFPLWLGEVKETQEDGLCFFVREHYGGGKIALRNLDNPSKYQSSEFAAEFIDELTKISYDTFSVLRGSKRWPGIERTVFAAASNPGGVGHGWVKRLWVDRDFPSELKGRESEFVFVRALPGDNPHLPPSYWAELNSLPEPLRSAWRDGNWDVFAGQAFMVWDQQKHVIQPFEIPAHWPRWRALDWGYSNPFCCLWLTRDPDTGRIYVYREVYARELTDRQQARTIRELTTGNDFRVTFADPAMWAKKNVNDLVVTTADEFAAEGVPLTRADNDRLSGKRKVDRALQNLPDGRPGLMVFSSCTNLIRTLPSLPYDKTNVEDVDTAAEDHAYDTLRYGLTNVNFEPRRPANQRRTQSPLERISHL